MRCEDVGATQSGLMTVSARIVRMVEKESTDGNVRHES